VLVVITTFGSCVYLFKQQYTKDSAWQSYAEMRREFQRSLPPLKIVFIVGGV